MSSNSKKITDVILALVKTTNWSASQEIIEQEQELLLSDETDLVLSNLLEEYKNNVNMTRVLKGHRELLHECKTNGIDAAFRNQISQRIPLDLPSEVTRHLASIRTEDEGKIGGLIENHPEVHAVLEKLVDATRLAFTQFVGQEIEEEEDVQYIKLTPQKRQALANKLKIFIATETLEETEAYLENHPELVTNEGLAVMELLIERAVRAGEENIINLFMLHHDILSDALDEKIDLELSELFSESAPMNIWDILNELTDCETYEEVLETVEEYPELLSDTVDGILEQSITHSRIDGHLGGNTWGDYLEARRTTLRKIREKVLRSN